MVFTIQRAATRQYIHLSIEDKTTKEYAALLSAATVQAVPATPEVPATVDAPIAY